MDTQTHLVLRRSQVGDLATELTNAVVRLDETGECQHVRVVLEQADAEGPWRLILTVVGENEYTVDGLLIERRTRKGEVRCR